MNKITITIVLQTIFVMSKTYCQRDSLTVTNQSIGIGIGYYHYASINKISDPYIYTGGNIDFLIHFKSITKKYRFDGSFHYAAINRMPANLTIPDEYRVISRDDGHVYQLPSFPARKKTKNLNLTFELYRTFKSVLFKNDYLGIGAMDKTSAILTNGKDDPEIVSSSLNPGIVYSILLKHNFNIQLKGNFSILSIYVRRPYASIEANLGTKEISDFEFIKDHLKLSSLNDYFEIFSGFELSKKVSRHFDIQFNYGFIYLDVQSPRQLSGVTNTLNMEATYKF